MESGTPCSLHPALILIHTHTETHTDTHRHKHTHTHTHTHTQTDRQHRSVSINKARTERAFLFRFWSSEKTNLYCERRELLLVYGSFIYGVGHGEVDHFTREQAKEEQRLHTHSVT